MDNTGHHMKLFPAFPPVSTNEWEDKINSDLKGADYEKKLVWKTGEGISVKPYYRKEDLESLEFTGARGGYPPVNKENNNWIIRQDITSTDLEEANKLALDAIKKGANAIGFCANKITTHKEMSQLLAGIDLTKTAVNFISSRSYPLTLELFNYVVSHRGVDFELVKGSLNFDPISFLLLRGDFYNSGESNFEEAEYIINTLQKKLPKVKAITINGHYFSDAGSTIVQELAFTIASANEYLYELTKKGFSVDTVAQRMILSFSIGSDYFFEIAKLRAARLLWTKLVEQYIPTESASSEIFIHSVTAMWNKTVYDPYVNMLRTTTEGMAAALGNTDSLTILPFSASFKDEDDFSFRIARNQQLILKEEVYLDKVVDPGLGSYILKT
jgi:methylmalonyl-CoA mutase